MKRTLFSTMSAVFTTAAIGAVSAVGIAGAQDNTVNRQTSTNETNAGAAAETDVPSTSPNTNRWDFMRGVPNFGSADGAFTRQTGRDPLRGVPNVFDESQSNASLPNARPGRGDGMRGVPNNADGSRYYPPDSPLSNPRGAEQNQPDRFQPDGLQNPVLNNNNQPVNVFPVDGEGETELEMNSHNQPILPAPVSGNGTSNNGTSSNGTSSNRVDLRGDGLNNGGLNNGANAGASNGAAANNATVNDGSAASDSSPRTTRFGRSSGWPTPLGEDVVPPPFGTPPNAPAPTPRTHPGNISNPRMNNPQMNNTGANAASQGNAVRLNAVRTNVNQGLNGAATIRTNTGSSNGANGAGLSGAGLSRLGAQVGNLGNASQGLGGSPNLNNALQAGQDLLGAAMTDGTGQGGGAGQDVGQGDGAGQDLGQGTGSGQGSGGFPIGGGYSSGIGASSYEESVLRGQGMAAQGMGQLISSIGQANLATSAGMINVEMARDHYLDNVQKYTQTYFDKRRINEEARLYARGQRPTAQDIERFARDRAPEGLTSADFEPASGRLFWPEVLQSAYFAEDRRTVEWIVMNYGIGANSVEALTGRMKDKLLAQVNELEPADYMDAKNFLNGLERESQVTPPRSEVGFAGAPDIDATAAR